MNYLVQGDVFIIPTAKKRGRGFTKVGRDKGRIVLAYGESTGHAHAILEADADLYETARAADRWLRVGASGATLLHEEHAPLTLPRGDYIVRLQREYSPEAIKRVQD